MESVRSHLQDPGWWFSAVIMGIFVSIASGFLRDWISKILSRFSKTLSERRRVKLERREILFEALAGNDVFMIASLIRLMGLVTVSFCMIGLFAILPFIAEIKGILCGVAPGATQCSGASYPVAEKFLMLGTGCVAFFVNYMASSRFILVMEGLRRYRVRNNLPRVI